MRPSHPGRPIVRAISFAIAVAFLAQELVWAAPLSLARPASVPMPSVAFKVPASAGIVDDFFKAQDPKLIVLIQDAHTNDSAQFNAARILEEVLRAERARLVFTEADHGDVSLDYLKKYFDASTLREVAGSFVRKGLLKGTEYLSVTSDEAFTLLGVESPALYGESLRVYASVERERPRALAWLDRLDRSLKAFQKDVFGADLARLDAQRALHRGGQLSLAAYADRLWDEAGRLGVYREKYRSLVELNRIGRLEKKIDFKAAAREADAALRTLEPSLRASLIEGRERASAAGAVKAGEDASAGFYGSLEEALRAAGPSRAISRTYPALAEYFRYLRQARRLEALHAVDQLGALESEVFARLARTDEERYLLEFGRNAEDLKDLLELKMSPEAFERFRSRRERFDPRMIAGYVNHRILNGSRHYDRAVFLNTDYERVAGEAVRFYELAEKRDQVFVERMVEAMERGGQTRAALFLGGFHAPGVKRLLRERGISYVSVLPQVTHETDPVRYERILLAQTAPVREGSAASAHPEGGTPAAAGRLAQPLGAIRGERIDFFEALAGSSPSAPSAGALLAEGARMADEAGPSRVAPGAPTERQTQLLDTDIDTFLLTGIEDRSIHATKNKMLLAGADRLRAMGIVTFRDLGRADMGKLLSADRKVRVTSVFLKELSLLLRQEGIRWGYVPQERQLERATPAMTERARQLLAQDAAGFFDGMTPSSERRAHTVTRFKNVMKRWTASRERSGKGRPTLGDLLEMNPLNEPLRWRNFNVATLAEGMAYVNSHQDLWASGLGWGTGFVFDAARPAGARMTAEELLSSVWKMSRDFILSRIRDLVALEVRGLSSETRRSLQVLPSGISVPDKEALRGQYALYVDLGGSTIHIGMSGVNGSGELETLWHEDIALTREDKSGGERLFDRIADEVARILKERGIEDAEGLVAGFTFSFPHENGTILPSADRVKGFRFKDVAGRHVLELMNSRLEDRGTGLRFNAVANDTEAALIQGILTDPRTRASIIAGTGFNIAALLRSIVTNLEAGGFRVQNVDGIELLDLERRFMKRGAEELISGGFAGELVRLMSLRLIRQGALMDRPFESRWKLWDAEHRAHRKIMRVFTRPGGLPAGPLFRMLGNGDPESVRGTLNGIQAGLADRMTDEDLNTFYQIARAVAERSADLVAAMAAGALEASGSAAQGRVSADGALWSNPEYLARVNRTIARLLGRAAETDIVFLVRNASGQGAALTALAKKANDLSAPSAARMAERPDTGLETEVPAPFEPGSRTPTLARPARIGLVVGDYRTGPQGRMTGPGGIAESNYDPSQRVTAYHRLVQALFDRLIGDPDIAVTDIYGIGRGNTEDFYHALAGGAARQKRASEFRLGSDPEGPVLTVNGHRIRLHETPIAELSEASPDLDYLVYAADPRVTDEEAASMMARLDREASSAVSLGRVFVVAPEQGLPAAHIPGVTAIVPAARTVALATPAASAIGILMAAFKDSTLARFDYLSQIDYVTPNEGDQAVITAVRDPKVLKWAEQGSWLVAHPDREGPRLLMTRSGANTGAGRIKLMIQPHRETIDAFASSDKDALKLQQEALRTQINEELREAAEGAFRGILGYSEAGDLNSAAAAYQTAVVLVDATQTRVRNDGAIELLMYVSDHGQAAALIEAVRASAETRIGKAVPIDALRFNEEVAAGKWPVPTIAPDRVRTLQGYLEKPVPVAIIGPRGRIGKLLFENLLTDPNFVLRAWIGVQSIETMVQQSLADVAHGQSPFIIELSAEHRDTVLFRHRSTGGYVLRPDTGKPVEVVYVGRSTTEDKLRSDLGAEVADEIGMVFNASGAFLGEDPLYGAFRNLKTVIITAPAKGQVDATVVRGLNERGVEVVHAADENGNGEPDYISCASCTTNAMARGLVELASLIASSKAGGPVRILAGNAHTNHAATVSQGALFGASSAGKSLPTAQDPMTIVVPESSGAAKVIGQVLPQFKQISVTSSRNASYDGSFVSIHLTVLNSEGAALDRDSINGHFKRLAAEPGIGEVIGYADSVGSSAQIVDDTRTAILIADQTAVVRGRDTTTFSITLGYDNEAGYARAVQHIALLAALYKNGLAGVVDDLAEEWTSGARLANIEMTGFRRGDPSWHTPGKKVVLIVEDEALLLMLHRNKQYLAGRVEKIAPEGDYEWVVVDNLQDAKEAADTAGRDLATVFTDNDFPALPGAAALYDQGIELIGHLAAREDTRDLQGVLSTGRGDFIDPASVPGSFRLIVKGQDAVAQDLDLLSQALAERIRTGARMGVTKVTSPYELRAGDIISKYAAGFFIDTEADAPARLLSAAEIPHFDHMIVIGTPRQAYILQRQPAVRVMFVDRDGQPVSDLQPLIPLPQLTVKKPLMTRPEASLADGAKVYFPIKGFEAQLKAIAEARQITREELLPVSDGSRVLGVIRLQGDRYLVSGSGRDEWVSLQRVPDVQAADDAEDLDDLFDRAPLTPEQLLAIESSVIGLLAGRSDAPDRNLKRVNFEIDAAEMLSVIRDTDTREQAMVRLQRLVTRATEQLGWGAVQFVGAEDESRYRLKSQPVIPGAPTVRIQNVSASSVPELTGRSLLPYQMKDGEMIPVLSSLYAARLIANLADAGSEAESAAIRAEAAPLLAMLALMEDGGSVEGGDWELFGRYDPDAQERYRTLSVKGRSLRGYLDLLIYLQQAARMAVSVSA